jgi:predicted dehydrogenase
MARRTRSAPLKVAVIGLAHLHPRSYMPLFQALPEVRVTSAMDPDAALRGPFCRDFGLAEYATLPALLRAERPDIAALFLPHADCPAAAAACAAAGAHLMVEKPMAASRAGAERIVAAARRHRVKLTTGYCWRLHPVAREIARLIRAGAIGRVVGGEGRCAAGRLRRYLDGKSPWMLERARSGGGPLFNLGVHWIDLCRMALGDEVVEVSGRNVKVNAAYDVEDNSFAHLRFSRGAIVALDISYTVPDAFPHGRDLYVSFRGTRGVISWAPAYEGQRDELVIVSDDPSFAGSPRRTVAFELQPTPGYSGYMGLEYVRAFARCVREGGRPPVTGEDGVEALRVVEAVYAAAARRRWVEIKR